MIKHIKVFTCFFLNFFVFNYIYSQKIKLSAALHEISGLEVWNDTLFFAINDSGNSPSLFLLNKKGEILQKKVLPNTQNKDWEDLTQSENELFIADVGNNLLKRNKFTIYRLNKEDFSKQQKIHIDSITFSYPNEYQTFDCESISYHKEELYLFTKNSKSNIKDKFFVFKLNLNENEQVVGFYTSFFLPKQRHYLLDGLTSATIYKDKLYLLTYKNLYIYNFQDKIDKPIKKIKLKFLKQWEAISVNDTYIYIANERIGKFNKQQIKRYKQK